MPWEKTENEIRHRLEDPNKFKQDSFRTKEIDKGVNLVMGKMMNEDTMTPQSLRFQMPMFDMKKAQEWFKEHWGKKKMSFGLETHNIQNVEIFSCGCWNGDEYTQDDLKDIVMAFEETNRDIPPFLKLGHNDEQELLKSAGLPAAGWVEKLRIEGDKLVADFINIPKKIHDLIVSKSYRKVSCEIFINLKLKDKIYNKVLGAVALLGAETPGCMNLADIIAQYNLNGATLLKTYNENNLETKILEYELNKEITMPTEKEIELENELKKAKETISTSQASVVTLAKRIDESEEENSALRKYKEESEKQKADLVLKAEKAEIEKFTTELMSEKLCSPAMKPLIQDLLDVNKKEFNIKTKDKEEKTDRFGLLKQALLLFKTASQVNFEENSESGQNTNAEKNLNDKIEKYILEHKVTYGQAVKAVLKK